jgi:predicted RNA-binding Zn ribbon-like protein
MASKDIAPGRLDVVRRFINTAELDEGTDELATPKGLAAWLAANDLAFPAHARVSAADVGTAAEVREALRAALFAHGGGDLDPQAPATLDAAAVRAGVTLRFGPAGESYLEPAADGVDAAIGRLLAIVAEAMADGTWQRLKACQKDDCRWAFYDHTRNRSGVWCSMAVCGNRTKVERFRQRQRG